MAEPFDTLGAAIADVIQRLADGVITEAQAGAELSPLLAGVNDGEFGARVEDIIGVMGRITGLLMVDAPPSNLLGAPGSYAWDRLNKVFYGPEDAVTGWPPGDAMTKGPPGPSIQLQVTATHIQWRVVGTSTWTNLIALSSLKGADGKEVSLQKSATHVQWRLGAGAWADLIPLADLKGATGDAGPKGDTGDQGPQGVQGEAGPKGDTGDEGPQGVQGQVGPKGDTGDQGPQGVQGQTGPKGDTGDAAWSPIFATVADGERRVLQVSDWTGGEGTKPATGAYLGETGFVATAAEATDVRGAAGDGAGDMLAANNLSDLTDKSVARTTLSVFSKAEGDARYPVMTGGKIATSVLPSLAITDVFPVASQAAMLALDAQRGDVAVRSDIFATFILAAEPASTLPNWIALPVPTDVVQSVAGLQGAISAGALKTALAIAIADVSGLATALAAKADLVAGKVPSAQLPDPPTVPVKASGAELRTATNDDKFVTPKALADADAYVAVAASGAFTLDFAAGRNFNVTLSANSTMNVPTNMKDGQSGTIRFVQDATGSRTLGLASAIKKFGAYTLSTAANAVDRCGYIVCNGVLELTALEKGLA